MKKISAKEATRLARNYPLSVRWSDEDQVFVGSIPGLVGECCHGDTPEQVIPQLKASLRHSAFIPERLGQHPILGKNPRDFELSGFRVLDSGELQGRAAHALTILQQLFEFQLLR